MKTFMPIATAVAAPSIGTAPAMAHVTLDRREAATRTTTKAVFRVPHGCAGAATTKLRIQIPQGVTEVAWHGGNLPNDEYDEFVLRGFLSTDIGAGTMLHFPVVQACEDGGTECWINIAEPGKCAGDHDMPAPGRKLLAGQ